MSACLRGLPEVAEERCLHSDGSLTEAQISRGASIFHNSSNFLTLAAELP